MISLRFVQGVFVFGSAVVAASSAQAQAAAAVDLVPPKQREKVVQDAGSVLASRSSPVVLPTPLPNPFIAKESPSSAVPDTPTATTAPESTLGGVDLLAKIAARIPATGTVSLGGEPLLLLGQKRLKVGDVYTISFEGQTYELSIAAVTPTSFTVKRGENIYTRPVRLSSTSTNIPTNRP